MKIYHSLKEIKKAPSRSVVTIGIFDGLHRGHIRIVKSLVKRAKELDAKSLVLTFYPHPSSVLHPKNLAPLLISLKHRISLLKDIGIDILVLLRFNKSFSKMKPETFITGVLQKRFGMKEILVGDNFNFGWRRSGDIGLLRKFSKKYGFRVKRIRLLKLRKRIISSSYIRSLILNGRLNEASRLLARPVSILGTVKKGTKRGRILGYPTANVDPHHEAIPPSSVYAVYIKLNNKKYKGVLNIGLRPTFYIEGYPPEPTIEVHIFNFNKDIYGKDLEIIFVKRLRPEIRFKDKDSLIKRIRLDEKAARRALE